MLFFKKKKEIAEKHRYIIDTYWLVDIENEDKFFKAYKDELDENDDYNLPARELKEDYEGEKVYKYEPFELPLKMDGLQVYSWVKEDEWMRIGRVKKTADLNGELTLYLYPNIYKYVTEDEIYKENRDPYYGIEVKKIL